MMKLLQRCFVSCFLTVPAVVSADLHNPITCGDTYVVERGDTPSGLSLRVYDSLLYQPIYTANVDVIGTNPDRIFVGQQFFVPCITAARRNKQRCRCGACMTHICPRRITSPKAHLLGFVAAPAAHIWRDNSQPITVGQGIANKNNYDIPYFNGLDTRGPAAMRAEVAAFKADYRAENNEEPTFFLAHGAAIALGVWDAESSVSVMSVDFRSTMLDSGLVFKKADKAFLDELFFSSLDDINEWASIANAHGIPSSEAVNAYLQNLRLFEDLLIYRADETFSDQPPFITGDF